MPAYSFQYVSITTEDRSLSVRALLGDSPPKEIGGYGGWEIVSRPKRVGLTHWVGRDPFRMSLPLLFDGWMCNESIEDDLQRLKRMAKPSEAGGHLPPPCVTVTGAVPIHGILWVIETITLGDNATWRHVGGRGVRYRQDVELGLLQYIDDDLVALATAKKRKTKKAKNAFHTVKKGETLQKIAQIEYGDASQWRRIADANNIRDPKSVKPGRRLRMP